MSEIYRWRTARRAHRCDGAGNGIPGCLHIIAIGARYREANLPPGGEAGYTGWTHWRSCTGCAAHYLGPADPKAVTA